MGLFFLGIFKAIYERTLFVSQKIRLREKSSRESSKIFLNSKVHTKRIGRNESEVKTTSSIATELSPRLGIGISCFILLELSPEEAKPSLPSSLTRRPWTKFKRI